MTVLNFDRVTPALAKALSEFHAAKCAFRELVRADRATGEELSREAQRIAAAEEAIFRAIEAMKVAGGPRP